MATAVAHPLPRTHPAPWWRGRPGAILLIVALMIVAFLGWKNEWSWPAALTWNSLSPHLDRFQIWLSDHRNLEHPGIGFRLFNDLATFLDDLVSWLTRFFFWL